MNLRTAHHALVIGTGMLLAPVGVLAQGPPDHADAPGHMPEDFVDREAGPDVQRTMIDRHLDRIARQRERLEAVKKMVEAGEPTERIRAAMRDAISSGFGARAPGARPEDRLVPGPGRGRTDARAPFAAGPRDGPHGGPREGPRDGPPGGPEFVPDGPELDSIIEFVQKNRPEMARRLSELRRDDPEEFRRFLRDKGQQIRRMMAEQRDNPELWDARRDMFDAEAKARRAARAARAADADHREDAVRKLREAIAAHYDARATVAQLELEGARRWVQRLEQEMKVRAEGREAFLNERLEKAMAGEELRDAPPPMPELGGPPGGPPGRSPGGPPGESRGGRPR